jgi:hypothetical protein
LPRAGPVERAVRPLVVRLPRAHEALDALGGVVLPMRAEAATVVNQRACLHYLPSVRRLLRRRRGGAGFAHQGPPTRPLRGEYPPRRIPRAGGRRRASEAVTLPACLKSECGRNMLASAGREAGRLRACFRKAEDNRQS